MTVKLRKPKKSNLTKPADSTSSLSYWLTRFVPSASQSTAEKSVSLLGAITTPPACLPVLRVMPSSFKPISQISLASSWSGLLGLVIISLSAGSALIASAKLVPGLLGISLDNLSANPYDLPCTRATSLITPLAAIVPKVAICETASRP